MVAKRVLLVGMVVGVAAGVWGCAPSIVSPDTGVWYGGKLCATSSRDMTSVYDATVAAMKKLELQITEQAKDVFYAKVAAKGADGKIVTVRIKPGKGNVTEFSIGVSPMGNKERSLIIYEQIQSGLAASKGK